MFVIEKEFSQRTHSFPPTNIEAEESVLGGIILDPNAIFRVVQKLESSHFSLQSHQEIYTACLKLHKNNKGTDLLSLTSYLEDKKLLSKIGGRSKLASLLDSTVSAVNIDSLADLVIEKATRRQIISLGHQITDLGYNTEFELSSVLNLIQQKTDPIVKNDKTQSDIERISNKYYELLRGINEIEENVDSPGLKHLLLTNLADKHEIRGLKELENIYQKSLLDKEDSPIMTYQELKELAGSEVRNFLMYGLVPEGTGILLHALGGIGKTKFLYFLCHLLAQGQSWGDFTTTKKCKILIIQTDETPGDLKQAFDTLGYPEGVDIRFKTNWVVDNFPKLKKEMEDFNPDLVLVDSITTVNKCSLFSENDVAYARPILQMCRYAAESKTTFFFIHHSSAGGEKARGTTALYNSVSEVWQLKLDPKFTDPAYKLLKIQKSRSRSSNFEYRLHVDYETLKVTCLGENSEAVPQETITKRQKILDFLRQQANQAYESEELSQILQISLNYTKKLLSLLKLEGLISWREILGAGYRRFAYYIKGDNRHIDCYPTEKGNDEVTVWVTGCSQDTEVDSSNLLPVTSKNHLQKNENFSEKNEKEGNEVTGCSKPLSDKEYSLLPNPLPNPLPQETKQGNEVTGCSKPLQNIESNPLPCYPTRYPTESVIVDKNDASQISVQGNTGVWIFRFWMEKSNRKEILRGQFISPTGESYPPDALAKAIIRDANALDNYTFAKVSALEAKMVGV